MIMRFTKIAAITLFLLTSGTVLAQESRTVLSGTVVSYGTGLSTRMRTANFTLYINGITADTEAERLIRVLDNDGQDALLKAIGNKDLGNFSVGAAIGRPINLVTVDDVDGQKRVRIIFERWLNLAELRWGYRSVDYPFSYIELFIDPRKGKGEGTFIAAARIRFKNNLVEVEDFGTLPSRLLNVRVQSAGPIL